MKVKSIKYDGNSTSSTLDLFESKDYGLDVSSKREIAKKAGQYIVEQINLSIARLTSPVSGGKYKRTLSPEYAAWKKKVVGTDKPNLQLSGEMLDQLDYREGNGEVEIGVFGSAAPRAANHNHFGDGSPVPERQFLPRVGQEFKGNIQKTIEQMIKDKVLEVSPLTRTRLAAVRDAGDLKSTLKELYPSLTWPQIRTAIARNGELLDLLDTFNLLRWL